MESNYAVLANKRPASERANFILNKNGPETVCGHQRNIFRHLRSATAATLIEKVKQNRGTANINKFPIKHNRVKTWKGREKYLHILYSVCVCGWVCSMSVPFAFQVSSRGSWKWSAAANNNNEFVINLYSINGNRLIIISWGPTLLLVIRADGGVENTCPKPVSSWNHSYLSELRLARS